MEPNLIVALIIFAVVVAMVIFFRGAISRLIGSIRQSWELREVKIKQSPLELTFARIAEGEPNTIPEVEEISSQAVKWSKVANLWWLCSDSYDARLALLGGSSKALIFDSLERTYHHARALGFDEAIVSRLKNMADYAYSSNDQDWTPQKREAFAHWVRVIFNSVAQLAREYQEKQPESFEPDPVPRSPM